MASAAGAAAAGIGSHGRIASARSAKTAGLARQISLALGEDSRRCRCAIVQISSTLATWMSALSHAGLSVARPNGFNTSATNATTATCAVNA